MSYENLAVRETCAAVCEAQALEPECHERAQYCADAIRMRSNGRLDWLDAKLKSQQAKIDALMLEYCPDEMTPEQIAEWESHQRIAPNGQNEAPALAGRPRIRCWAYLKGNKMDFTPEHTKRGSIDHASVGELHPDISAAYDYVDSVIHTADVTTPYAWHGWALREAFLAGISYAEKTPNV